MNHNKELKRMNKRLKDAKANYNTWAKLPKGEGISEGSPSKASITGTEGSSKKVAK